MEARWGNSLNSRSITQNGETRTMEKTAKKARRPQTAFGKIGTSAQLIQRGPRDIVIDDLDGERFYGWPHLMLEVRDWQSVRFESRSVYANLFDKSQNSAILRAVYWDAPSTRTRLKAHPKTFRLVLPARFVVVPVRRLRKWLAEFSGVHIKLPDAYQADKTADVKRLRIERSYLSQVFEVVWQLKDQEYGVVNERWDRVWIQMTRALTQAPTVDIPDEDFWFVNPKIRYNLTSYQPDRYVPIK